MTEKYRLAVILVDGDFRIHHESCRDVARDATKSDGGAWHMEVASRHEVNTECWGDVASDNYEEGSLEWHAECDRDAAIASHFLPCVPALPETVEATEEPRN